jgi:multidrug efflux pump subunit AcrB
MRLPKLAIQNHQFVWVIVIMALAVGLLSYLTMPRSEDPVMEIPNYSVVAVYPGTSPQDMEELVVDPLEEAINELDDLTEISTRIEDGLAVIQVEADYSVDADDKYDEILSAVNAITSELPDELLDLKVNQFSPFDVKIIQLALTSEQATYVGLKEVGESIEKRLERLVGIGSVAIEGCPEQEVRIALDFEKMAALKLSLAQVMGTLQANNANIPGGDLDAGGQNFSLKTSGGYESLEQLRQTVIAAPQGRVTYLRDIAEVRLEYEDPTYLARFNGKKAVFISATLREGYNILEVSQRLDEALGQVELPAGYELHVPFKQAPAVANRINDFFLNLLQGVLLVGLIILLFLGYRNALIVVTVIPTSIILAIFLLDQSGFGLQQISIAGLVIALGLLVDNGIVVVENINRYLGEGYGKVEAAIQGTREVGWALVSSTATTVLAFFPMTQLGGGTGQYLISLPVIVIFALLASLVLALGFTPLLASRLMKQPQREFLTPFSRGLSQLVERGYRPLLQFALKRPLLVLLLAVGSLGGSFALFPLVGVSFFPTADKPILLVDIDTPEGSSLAYTDRVARYVEETVDSMALVRDYTTNVGHGNPQIYYNIIPENYKKNHAQILLNLENWEARSFYSLINQLREEFAGYPGAKIKVIELKNGPPYEAPIAIKLIGDEVDSLRMLAQRVEKLIAGTPGTVNTSNPLAVSKTDLKARIQRDKAGILGLRLSDIDLAVRTAITGTEVGSLSFADGSDYDMVVRLPFSGSLGIADFSRLYLGSVTGAQVPLRQVVKLELQSGPAKIDHYELERTVTLTADLHEGYNVTATTEQIIAALEKMNFPKGYSYYVAGEYEAQQEGFGDLGQMLIVAVLGILAILILQFRSFLQPVIVLSAIPLAFTGSIVALFLTGFSFSFFAFVGFTSLMGIVVNSSIILVDYANQLRAKGASVWEAIQQAAETRFNPIMLTTLTTICGLLPLTLGGSDLWAPLGWTIIGGMVSSTLLTLLIVPILYRWLSR